jgi:hypothetical protein
VETGVVVFGAEQAVKKGSGKPATGPLAIVVANQSKLSTNQL